MADKTQINLERIRACDAEWEESKHPRSENGQFTSGGGVKVSKATPDMKKGWHKYGNRQGFGKPAEEAAHNEKKARIRAKSDDLTTRVAGEWNAKTAKERRRVLSAAKQTLAKARPKIAAMRELAQEAGGGATVSKIQSGGKAKASSIKAGEIAKNQERYDNAHKSMAANYLSDLTNAIKGGDYETAREKLERHEKDKKRYDQLTAQNNKFKAAKKTLEKARPGIAKMREQAKAAGDFPRRNVEAALKAHIKEIKSNFAGYPDAAKKLENEARETFKQLEKSGKLDDVAKMLDRQAQLKAEGDKTRNMTERANWFDNLSKEDKALASVSFVGVAKMALNPTSAKPQAPVSKKADANKAAKEQIFKQAAAASKKTAEAKAAKEAAAAKKTLSDIDSRIAEAKRKGDIKSVSFLEAAKASAQKKAASAPAKTTKRFDKDMEKANKSYEDFREVMQKRKSEIDVLNERLRTTKNSFVAQATKQELDRLVSEYNQLDEMY